MTYPEMRKIVYILKGYPRLSETFIINEIYLLEQMGVTLRIFSLKGGEGQKSHAVVDKIQASVTYLPKTKSVTATPFMRWLATHLPKFAAAHSRLIRRRPQAYLRALSYAIFGLSLQCSLQSGIRFKKSFIKEFLQAGTIAEAILAEKSVGHLHGHFCHGATTVTMLVSHMTGIPFSFTAHAKDIYLPDLNPNGLLATKLAAAEFVATCTDANRRHLEALYPGGAPIHTIYHGLDTTKFAPVDRTADGAKIPVILSVGRFVEKKGFPYLVEACRLLRDRGHIFHCRIVGQPDEQSALITKLIDEGDLGTCVSVQGGVTQEELRRIYHESTIFALPCFVVDNGDRDGIPNVLAEAMATALPVVSTNISGIPEIVSDGVNGLLVPQKDATALANALERLLTDPALRGALGHAACTTIRDLFDSWQTTVALRQLFLEQLAKVQEQATVDTHSTRGTEPPAVSTVWR
ncbi:MAG TPA: glycosyltransferase family 4 protein [Caldilineaceae bacterium]|nr:glycosyltransferase family 4 protein [Caldilineaceae bacterium]